MKLARVVGSLVASRKDEGLEGLTFRVLRDLAIDGTDTGGEVVAVDSVGAGVGEVVLYATGSSARQTQATQNRPCDAIVMAIVDSWEVDGTTAFRKTDAKGPWAS